MAPSDRDAEGSRHDGGPADDVDARPGLLSLGLIETAARWWRFVGPVRALGVAGVVLVLGGIGWWMLRPPEVPTEARLPLAARADAVADTAATTGPAAAAASPTSRPSTPASTTTPVVVVHVAGAVRRPGVYELRGGQRVADAIVAAGGALAGADPDALNLAAPISDGDRIAIPLAGAEAAGGPSGGGHEHAAGGGSTPDAATPVDVNTASSAELQRLPGIGPMTAAAIVEHREQHGPFASVADLEAVRGIGPAKIEAIRDLVAL